MKNHIKISILFLFVLMGCEDFLDIAPTAAVSSGNYFVDDQQLETGVIAMYDAIQGVNSTSTSDNHSIQYEFYITEMRSDNTRTKSSEGEAAQFESYTIQSTNGIVLDYYRSMYNVIYRANLVLENIDVASDANRDQFEGEAKFVRAYAYFNLVRLFGDVPLLDRVIGPEDEALSFTRTSTADVYSLITSDLQDAVAKLGKVSINRASKAAAQAMLAKVYLTQGTNYVEAQQLLEAIIGTEYSLEDDFRDVFYSESNDEVIFAIGYLPDLTSDSQNFSSEWLNAVGRTSGVNYVTTEAREALDNLGGARTQYSYRQDQRQPTEYQVVKYLPDGDESLGIPATSTDPTLAGNDWIVIRYADVLLMHVEAIMAGANETSSGSAISSFQQVRSRAGITTPVATITKEDLLNERRVELAFENHRWFDLVRLGVARDVLSAFSAANNYSFSDTDLLLPIPQAEINLSKGLLTQNPGY
ncbi:putative outer membrane starch-binding protein [Roseivirga pacifica]|uniref:Starch-binding associating with outer membrane n=1 Tax=Roseivirga pacifica TaxID=1267423 RepID=A0A1I0M9V3_9BACT|nr:RagB/SusD family nutrient uptake outer membrane protein [Roseivirga pacifica]RKQ50210.1 putative outer membrane starch-binding protein [Roseivirga pacifica]SEV85133.1 Starch-binding associating with outer membrane [Roseivirga pacifica]